MPAVITPGPLAELFFDPAMRQRVGDSLEETIWKSFAEDAVRDGRDPPKTQTEVRRRFKICEKWIRALHGGDFSWSMAHVLDMLPTLLRAELDGHPLDPSRLRGMWAVPGSERVDYVDPRGPDLAREEPADDPVE